MCFAWDEGWMSKRVALLVSHSTTFLIKCRFSMPVSYTPWPRLLLCSVLAVKVDLGHDIWGLFSVQQDDNPRILMILPL